MQGDCFVFNAEAQRRTYAQGIARLARYPPHADRHSTPTRTIRRAATRPKKISTGREHSNGRRVVYVRFEERRPALTVDVKAE